MEEWTHGNYATNSFSKEVLHIEHINSILRSVKMWMESIQKEYITMKRLRESDIFAEFWT